LPGVSLAVEDHPQGLKRIALAPGATYGLAKTWPLDCALDFCRQCLSEGAELLLLGDQAARGFARDLVEGLAEPVRSEVEGRPGVVDLTGKTDLPQVAGILQTLHGYAGNDSGLMHVAAALGVPTVGIFGSSNPGWTRPLGPFCRTVVAEGFPCHPCYLKTCNQAEFCLASISGQQVYSELQELMKEKEVHLP
jgi:heptosyltransferase-2